MEITTVIINFQTPDLLQTAVESFKKYYPQVPLLIIDNGSKDNSIEVIHELQTQFKYIEAHFLKENIYHGPAMDLAAKQVVTTDYIFFLDSDTETKKKGFFEKMEKLFLEDKVYGAGEIISVNKRGYKSEKGQPILLTPYMLIDRRIYNQLSPFIHHGQPTINNFNEANKKGYKLKEFPFSKYILHHWRGTASRFGYKLGWRGKLDFILNKFGL